MYETTRVVKTISPSQAGALKLARQFEHTLVCVRYRHNADGKIRYTTVELVVDQAPIRRRRSKNPNSTEIVGLQVPAAESLITRHIRANGGQWDNATHLWRLPRSTAKRLGLLGRVVVVFAR